MNMLTAIIVDDENLSVKMMESILDWHGLGISISGTAENGIEALELFYRVNPNIIITDIRMPGLNGLDFIKKAKLMNPEAEFILISAFADFDYVKKAMELGCCNYILKPVDEYELEQTLKKIVAKIEDKKAAEKDALKKQMEHHKLAIYHYMNSGANPLAAGKSAGKLEVNFESYCLFNFILKDQSINDYIEGGMQLDAQMPFIMERMSSVIKEFGQCMLFPYSDYSWTAILSGNCSQEDLQKCALKMITLFKNEIHRDINVCFSPQGTRFDELPQLYRHLTSLIRYSAYVRDEPILGYGYNIIEEYIQQTDFLVYIKQLTDALNNNESEDAACIVEEVLMLSCKSNPEYLHLFIDFYYTVFCAIREKLVEENKLSEEHHEILNLSYKDISDMSTANEISRFLNRIIQLLQGNHLQPARSQYGQLVETAIRYLSENYNRNLSLEEICTELAVSKNYFSYLFKQKTGKNLWAYLTDIRVSKSKELLRTTAYKSYEIAYMVGYDNPSYFSKLFKKSTGQTPNEYRAAIKS